MISRVQKIMRSKSLVKNRGTDPEGIWVITYDIQNRVGKIFHEHSDR